MARQRQTKSAKRAKAGKKGKAADAARVATADVASPLPGDYRMGLTLFILLEVATILALAMAERTAFGVPQAAGWRSAYVGLTAALLVGLIALWLAGPRTNRSRLLIGTCVLWVLFAVGRLVPMFLLAGTALPAVLTIFVGQLAVALMVPAAAIERARNG